MATHKLGRNHKGSKYGVKGFMDTTHHDEGMPEHTLHIPRNSVSSGKYRGSTTRGAMPSIDKELWKWYNPNGRGIKD